MKFNIFIILSSLLVITSIAFSKEDDVLNTISYGFNKNINNMDFIADADLNFKTSFGNYSFKMNYFGIATLPKIDFRDNLNSNFLFSYPINTFSEVLFLQSVDFYGEEQFFDDNIPVNKLLKSNSLAGLGLKNIFNSNFNIYYGLENQEQSGFISNGNTLFSELSHASSYEDYKLNADANLISSKRTFDRTYQNSNASVRVNKSFDQNNRISIAYTHYGLVNDIIQTQNAQELEPDIETRDELRSNIELNLDFALDDNINNRSIFNYATNNNSESHRFYNVSSPRTGVLEERNEQLYSFRNQTIHKTEKVENKFQLELILLRKNFNVVNKFNVSPSVLVDLERSAFNKDKENNSILMSYTNKLELNSRSYLTSGFTYGIYREDTPSEEENSDNDDQNVNFNMDYSYRLNDHFQMNIAANARYRNFVYLKKEFSSQNFTQRSLSINPYFRYQFDDLVWLPDFQIAVEYISFDFKSNIGQSRGNIKRFLYYKDTLQYKISNDLSIDYQSQFLFREAGNFNWDSFTQTISNNKLELLSKLIFYNRINDDLYFGIGFRYYKLNDERDKLLINSYSPETDLKIRIGSTSLQLSGWYEFQFNNKRFQTIPNLYLNTLIDI